MLSMNLRISEAAHMGCNLKDLAKPNPIQLSDLSGQRIAVDAFLTAYQFITSLRARGDGKDGTYLRDSKGRPVSHLMGFLDRCATLVEAGIDPVFVFDGRPHELKFETLADRKERRQNAVQKWEAAIESQDWKAADKLGAQVVSYTPEMVQETQEMLDFCAEHNVVSDVEVIDAKEINKAYGRVERGEVKYRVVIDINSLR